ncbi:MAG: TolC family protein [Saprospiraceae bacterium]|nr:TolC family protein [Saprospiraceae bacterium]
MNLTIKNIVVVFIWLISFHLSGQEIINLDKAVEISKANNAKLRSDAGLVKYQQALVNTAYNFAPTQINAELGQFNSAYFDTGLGFSQTFSLPKVYQRRAAANQQQVKTAEYYLKLSEAEISQHLDHIFMEYNYLTSREKLLKNQDSLYNAFVEKSLLRWQKGETDILEKTTAEQQKLTITNQLIMIGKMKDYVVLQLQWYLNDGRKYVPQTDDFGLLKYSIFYDSNSLQKHPVLQMAAQEITTARAMTQAEKTALWPELSAGYRNVSIRGTGADNVVYQGGDRLSSFQVGVGIPIFRKGIRASIQSAQMMEEVKADIYIAKKSEISAQIQEKYVLYNANIAQLEQYEKSALPNARLIRSVSEQQFNNGQINYLEYVMLTNQAIAIESEYLELKRNLNMYIIDLYYLTTNYE